MFCISAIAEQQQSAGGLQLQQDLTSTVNGRQSIKFVAMEGGCSPVATELEKALDFAGLLMTNKNVAEEEDFDIEISEIFNVSYLPLHSLFALPVCWASARLRPVKNMPLNTDIFDDENEVVEIAAVLAFPKEAQKLKIPVTLDVSRCGRITLPPKKAAGGTGAEDALLIYSYRPKEDEDSLKKKSPTEVDNKTVDDINNENTTKAAPSYI